jgi:hypothetical protein
MFRAVLKILQLPLALIVMFYEWGWQSLSAVFTWLAKRPLWGLLEGLIRRAPPYTALVLFLLPSVALFPVKIGALWLIANGQKILGVTLIVIAKIVGTAVVARLFMLTQPALMQLAWFARFYHWFKRWKDAWMAVFRASWPWRYIRMLRMRIRQRVKRLAENWRSWRARRS